MIRYLSATGAVFFKYRYLLRNLVQRDIKVKYRRSALGVLWSVLNPLLMMIIMTAVFSTLFTGFGNIEYYPVYLLCGQTVFNFFSEATNLAMDSVLGNAALIKKVYIPKYIFPFEKVTFSLINTAFSFIPLIGVILVLRVPVTPWILLFPIPFVLLFFFNLGIGMALSSVVIFFRDMKHFYGVLLLALTYLTPLFYPVEILPPFMLTVVRLNPLYWYVTMFRTVVLNGEPFKMVHLAATALCALLAMLFGTLILKRTQDKFILYI